MICPTCKMEMPDGPCYTVLVSHSLRGDGRVLASAELVYRGSLMAEDPLLGRAAFEAWCREFVAQRGVSLHYHYPPAGWEGVAP